MKWARERQILAALALLCVGAGALAADPPTEGPRLSGRVMKVLDGDTFSFSTTARERFVVRFNAIDTPEQLQRGGAEATRALRELLRAKPVSVACYKRDERERRICRVFNAKGDVGLQMVELGAAWHFRRFESEQTPAERAAYRAAEDRARAARRGLWATPKPMPPWDCRERLRNMERCG
ncbi:MAG TPA: thermonuclease family protein [Burkholderiaceae bacterium]|nr:thermonuclease family protein [Burkholderiaceae bacterium]